MLVLSTALQTKSVSSNSGIEGYFSVLIFRDGGGPPLRLPPRLGGILRNGDKCSQIRSQVEDSSLGFMYQAARQLKLLNEVSMSNIEQCRANGPRARDMRSVTMFQGFANP